MADEQRTTKSNTVPAAFSNVTQAAFLAAYAQFGMVKRAAQVAKINRTTHHDWLRDDPTYRPRFEAAHHQAITAWEDEVSRRAFLGTRKPVYQGGKKVGSVLEFSDGLAQFLLKANNHEMYGDKSTVALSGSASIEGMQANQAEARRRAKQARQENDGTDSAA
jgi:hypothetical protein